MVRESAENRVYGLVNNLSKLKAQKAKVKIVVTGCMVGMAVRDKSGKLLRKLKKRMPGVDEFLPIEEVGFDNAPLRTDKNHAWVPISTGCNNFCTFCVVPFSRGREISRPFEEILDEVYCLVRDGYERITLLGMNVNSYGADIVKSKVKSQKSKLKINGIKISPVMVKHLGRYRIPTLFPYLLEEVCKVDGIKKIDFISSNPWDFSDELIDVVARNLKITRTLHLAVQSGNNEILKKMNRWYTKEEYIKLIEKIRRKIKGIKITTDIIVGFCGETEEQFQDTVDLCKKVGFKKAYIARYSDRPMTAAHKAFKDNVPAKVKKKRWQILDKLVNGKNKFYSST
jgi:tRNA-2-methylthio-N6-dimethylallyladenosine synthase